jgi:hypothetical protein
MVDDVITADFRRELIRVDDGFGSGVRRGAGFSFAGLADLQPVYVRSAEV